MKDILHRIADEKVDVYAENERFSALQLRYRETQAKGVRDQLWIIAYRCACNILKAKLGGIKGWEDISQLATDMVIRLFRRIDDRERWPDGYKVLNLPTVLTGIYFTLYYGKKEIETVPYEEWTDRYLAEGDL